MIRLQRLLVPTDFSDTARLALRYASSFAREFDAELVLVHVVENVAVGYANDLFPVPMAEVVQELTSYAKAELDTLAKEVEAQGLKVRVVLAQGKPSAEILRLAAAEKADMIILGTHGKGMLDQAIFGSTTERVVRKAPCPVLSVRESEHDFVD